MSIPVKPWEAVGNTGSIPGTSSSLVHNAQTDRLHSSAIPFPGSGGGSSSVSMGTSPGAAGNTPPLPPRPGQTRPIYSTGGMYGRSSVMPYSSAYSSPYYGGASSMYSSPYSTMGGYGMGSYGGYGGGYGGYGARMGMYGGYGNGGMMNPDGTPTFSQLAEESSAGAFQSIESFVSAFGSISAMLESTFHAVYSSFRAVVGVADHMGRLKHILSAMAVFRFFRWVIRRFLYLVGISKIKPEDVESLWNTMSGEAFQGDRAGELEGELYRNPKASSWPILMFLGFILAGPYLMWKLISSLNLDPNRKVANKAWASGQADHFLAVAEYDFEGMADRELKLRAGQKIRLAPASSQPPNVKGWVLASDGIKIGLVPTNYLKILGKRSGGAGEDLSVPPPKFVRPPLQPVTPAVAAEPVAQTKDDASADFVASPEANPDIVVTPPENR